MKIFVSFCVFMITFYLGIRAVAETKNSATQANVQPTTQPAPPAPSVPGNNSSAAATNAAATAGNAGQNKSAAPAEIKKIPKIETISSVRLVSIDQQIFTLHEDETSWGVVPAISFSKGERVQRTFPAPVKDWQDWRARFLQMMSSFPRAVKCPHPIMFQSELQGENYRDKEVCLDELTNAQRAQVQQLTKEWSKFLYGS